MTALHELRADICPGCGLSLTDTTAPSAESAYRVGPPTRCHACTAVAAKRAGEYESAPHPHALFWHAERTT